MDFQSWLKPRYVAELKQIARKCGSPLAGDKQMIVSRLVKTAQCRVHRSKNPLRLVSIDVGIKNIGVTQVTVPPLKSDLQEKLSIDRCYRTSITNPHLTYPSFANEVLKFLQINVDSTTDIVLIERQQPRILNNFGILSNITQNLVMEGMCFMGLKTLHPQLHVESVDPKLVLDFWSQKRIVKSKEMRKLLVNKWIENEEYLEFKEAFEVYGKSDDMYDSLVQAVTWCKWRENSYKLLCEFNGR